MGLVASVVLLMGCGGTTGTATVKVTGTVTYRGKALSGVNVTFTPEKGRPAGGTTDSSGRFSLTTVNPGDGAVEGNHTVTITPGPASAPPPMPGTPEAKHTAATRPPFPAKYSDPRKSGLTASVKRGSSREFTFELRD